MIWVTITVSKREGNRLERAREWASKERVLDQKERRVLEILGSAQVSPQELRLTLPQVRAIRDLVKRNGPMFQRNAPVISRALAELESIFSPDA